MRDPARIPRILDLISKVWLANPDLRFCQLIYSCVRDNNARLNWDSLNLEDDLLEKGLEKMIAKSFSETVLSPEYKKNLAIERENSPFFGHK